MKIASLFLFVVACGRSECQDYATVSCGKASLCIVPVEQRACEEATMKQLQAQRVTEDQCKTAREKISGMNCTEFKAFLAPVVAR